MDKFINHSRLGLLARDASFIHEGGGISVKGMAVVFVNKREIVNIRC